MNDIPSRYYKFAKIAIDLAGESDNDMTHSLCAMIVKRNRVLSIGYNSNKTNPIMDTRMQQLHAECDAIIRCHPDDLCGADIVVARTRSYMYPGLAKPCSFCQAMLTRCGVRKVYYTTNVNSSEYEDIELRRMTL